MKFLSPRFSTSILLTSVLVVLVAFGGERIASGVDETADVADPTIHYAGTAAELSVLRVSDRTIEVQLVPIGPAGKAEEPPASNLLVDYPRELIWRGRALEAPLRREIDGGLVVDIRPAPLSVVVRGAEGAVVQALSWPGGERPEADGTMRFRTEAPVFGLGQGGPQFDTRGHFDRRGHVFPMADGWGAYERPTHGTRTAAPMLVGIDGWSMFVHHPISRANVFDLTGGGGRFRPDDTARTQPVRLFVTAWERPAQVFSEYTRIAGHAPMPPKWALGYMQSHRTLAGPGQMEQIARTFREKNLPADVLIYLGTGFTPSGWNEGHGSFTFNPEVFDEPAAILDTLHALNFEVALHTYSPPAGLHGTSLRTVPEDSAHIGTYWNRHTPLVELGIDGWWPDGGEGLSAESRVARHRMYYEGPLSDRPNERPWSLHRTGYSGAHRYGGWMWSGDPDSYWETLKTHIAVGLNHTVSLTPFWGSDTGGFLPTEELTGELYVRWFQFSAFCPLFRSHGRAWHLRLPWGWNTAALGPPEVDAFSDAFADGYPYPEELRNGLVEPIARQYLQLRYRLLPYNYTLTRTTHDTGLPPMRAMWLHYPDDPQAVRRGDQYLWGRSLLVAPVYTKGAAQRTVYLPEGTWYDFWTAERQAGGREITRRVDLATMPIYVRAGTILPLAPVRQYTAQEIDEPVTLRIYTGSDGTFRWYRDDGRTLDYREGEYSWTRFQWDEAAHTLTIAPDPESDGKAPAPAMLRLKLMPSGATQMVAWDGTRTEVSFE